jgi:3-oxoadipate enol-lactonase
MTVAVHYTVDGPPDAPVLVLGSSLGATSAVWESQVPALARRFRVVRYDHRGHGASPVPPAPYRLEDLGADVVALLDRLDVARAGLAGLSLGGMVSMWVAAHAPQRVDRLALLCTSVDFAPAQRWLDRAAAVRAGGMDAVADAVIDRWFTPGFAARHPDRVAAALRMLRSTPVEGYAGGCAAIASATLAPALARITAPTLVVAADADPAAPREEADRVVAAIPGARLRLVADAAHLAPVEQPAAVARLLGDFFSGNTIVDTAPSAAPGPER